MINWFRCDFQERDDGIYFCEGLHPRGNDCQWSKLTLAHIQEMVRLKPRVPDTGDSAASEEDWSNDNARIGAGLSRFIRG